MRRPRITIVSLLGIVAFVGVALAALREATEDWDSALFGLTVLLLLASVLLAVHRTGERRAFWRGFALFGWAYLVSSLVPPIESWLPTSKALPVLGEMMGARPEFPYGEFLTSADHLIFDVPTAATMVPSRPARWFVAAFQRPAPPIVNPVKPFVGIGEAGGNFARIGHSLFAMSFALVGALLSRRLYPVPESRRRPVVIAAGGSGPDDRGRPAGVPTTLEAPKPTNDGSGSSLVVPIPRPRSQP